MLCVFVMTALATLHESLTYFRATSLVVDKNIG